MTGVITPVDGVSGDNFGRSVAISANGLTVIIGGDLDDIGPNTNQGSARVFDWNGSTWLQRGAPLTPTDGSIRDFFGVSVSLSADGNVAIVGGDGDDVGTNEDQGSARVFAWNGSAWVQRGNLLTPPDGAAFDGFGWSVALSRDGNTAVVGSVFDDVGANQDQGSARVFDWNGRVWAQRGFAITPFDGAQGDEFGRSVAISANGNTVVVGGAGDDVGANQNQGSARVFDWVGNAWVQRGGAITPVDGLPDDVFGSSAALSANGNTVILGGLSDDLGGNRNQGSARVFDWNGSAWIQRGGPLSPTDGAAFDNFGQSVALSADGNTAVVGGNDDRVGANFGQGSARVFDWAGSAWVQRAAPVSPIDGAAGDSFGDSVALSADGNTAVIGGSSDDVGANQDLGSARLFDWTGSAWIQRGASLPSATLSRSPPAVAEDGQANLIFTITLSTAATTPISVTYTVDGTATLGTDYPVLTGIATIPAGESTTTIIVDPIADPDVESDETVRVTLTAGNGYDLGMTVVQSGTISDDDRVIPSANLSLSPNSVAEDGTGNLVYVVTLSSPITTPVSVTYTLGGTASSSTDYATTPISRTVTIAAGQLTASIVVDPRADTTVEVNETVTVTLTGGTGYVLGTTVVQTGTITNDDSVTAQQGTGGRNPNTQILVDGRSVTPSSADGAFGLRFVYTASNSGETIVGTNDNDLINAQGGVDAVDGGAGNDIIDGGTGSNFLSGGAGRDMFFVDGRGTSGAAGNVVFSTITDFDPNVGEKLTVFGWRQGISGILFTEDFGGANGFRGATFHLDLDGDNLIDASFTLTGLILSGLLPTFGSTGDTGFLLIG